MLSLVIFLVYMKVSIKQAYNALHKPYLASNEFLRQSFTRKNRRIRNCYRDYGYLLSTAFRRIRRHFVHSEVLPLLRVSFYRHICRHGRKICNVVITPCPKKTKQICFCQNCVKFSPILIIFGRKMANDPNICEVHSFFHLA